ncbi:Histone-lysine N-methyltransferase ASH1L [Paramyrothecium foliicola]|nr:Histone-lysine N-methyltransferase ASH1L [Paramyrothecium foliicola]
MSVSADSATEAVTDTSSNLASSSSTPPTTIADSASIHSESSKQDVITVADDAADAEALIPPPPARSRRATTSAPVYNLSQLSGTAGHGKRRANGDVVADRRRRTISGGPEAAAGSEESLVRETSRAVRDGIDALDLQWSPGRLNTPRTRRQIRESPRSMRNSSRLSSAPVASIGTKLSSMSKRSRKAVDKSVTKMSRELRRLQDTKEFAHIDEKPVVHTVWSNGKFIDPNQAPPTPARKKAKVETEEKEPEKEEKEPTTNARKRRTKKYLNKGLYAGQDAPKDPLKGLTIPEKKKLAQYPELQPSTRANKIMPAPMFTGLRMLIAGRDFKLPYQVCNPLPPGQPKPDEWKKMTKNRFIGDSKDYWRKSPHFHDFSSKCVCKPEDGCGESCQNRIMLYECDENNCNIGKKLCTNRAFADLTARRARGGKYRVGVEVIKTSDRGYGVRSNRCFRPHQIIMEYAGEIITEIECERRMNEIYKNNECYYLMSFDQNMIIDATTGSIARFVNHSCQPNCRMIKWIVSGQPRMALFAGDRPIMTGDELTYDYNFDPFSAKNVQKCLCGSDNCRGVLGPKPKEVKPPKSDLKASVKATAKATVKAGKRKLKELIGDGDQADNGKAKKRKIMPVPGVKRSLSTASLKVAKGAATALKNRVATITVNAKKVTTTNKSPIKRRASTGALLKATTTKKVVKTYGKSTPNKQVSSRSSSLTIVAMGEGSSGKGTKKTPTKKVLAVNKATPRSVGSVKSVKSAKKTATPRKALELTRTANIRVVTSD